MPSEEEGKEVSKLESKVRSQCSSFSRENDEKDNANPIGNIKLLSHCYGPSSVLSNTIIAYSHIPTTEYKNLF